MLSNNEVRQKYLEFYQERGHQLVASAPIVPQDDPSILFIIAGMAQFKNLFLNLGDKPYDRATSVQKCFRTNDIENVGVTASHHTFFEMLGNFSFGDYFKEQAIKWCWELYTDCLGFDKKNLWVTVFRDDDDAFNIWKDVIGLPAQRIHRFDEKDNFWSSDAKSGPCGPCSEIYFDPNPDKTDENKPDYEEFVEMGNIVFMQFNRDEGKLVDLPKPNIDFGGGLERITAMLQGKKSNYEIDTFVPIIGEISDMLETPYDFDSSNGRHIRRIADHIRGASFCIADQALPSNVGRGYVVRRIIRRAISSAKALGMDTPLLHKLVPVIAEQMGYYTEIKEQIKNIEMFIESEEKLYLKTLTDSAAILVDYIADMKKEGVTELAGERAFYLYDTLGLPLEETENKLQEQGFTVDHAGYETAMQDQRTRAKAGSSMQGDIFVDNYMTTVKSQLEATEFLGYTELDCNAQIKAIAVNEQLVDAVEAENTELVIITDRSPFYAESGGQVGDRGIITQDECIIDITDTQKDQDYILHKGVLREGTLTCGESATLTVDKAKRDATEKNHTAAHLLHKHLKIVLGDHVNQAGSLVDEDRCRFDFTQPKQVTKEQLQIIEAAINADIQTRADVFYRETSLTAAKAEGVVALFGEKYGNTVRVVDIGTSGTTSKELCGGTHIRNIGEIAAFKFVSETAIAAGVRRVEAVTGAVALEHLFNASATVSDLSKLLAVKENEVLERINKTLKDQKDLQKQVNQFQKQGMLEKAKELISTATEINGVKVISHHFKGVDGKSMRDIANGFKGLTEPHMICLLGDADGKVSIVVKLDKQVIESKGVKAGALIAQVAACVGGKGGGKPDLAQAGGNSPEKIPDALKKWQELVDSTLS